MEVKELSAEINLEDRLFTGEELEQMGIEFTSETFSNYLIYKKDNMYYLVDRLSQDEYRIHLNFAD